MTNKIIKNKNKGIFIIGLLAMTSCRQDNLPDYEPDYSSLTPTLEFKAAIKEKTGSATRAMTQPSVPVQANDFPCNFYIETYDPSLPDYAEGEPVDPGESSQVNPQFGTYKVPTNGSGGMLSFTGNLDDKPNWCNIDDDHYFWAWTVPWDDPAMIMQQPEKDDEGDEGDEGGEEEGEGTETLMTRADPETPGAELPPLGTGTYTPSRNPLTFTLRNTTVAEFNYEDSVWNEGSWGNGYMMEAFVAAKNGPFDFRRNGPEVPLDFRHLMSKISLRSLTFYAASGAVLENLRANITFINMPTTFTLYPHPTAEDVADNPDYPYMVEDGPPVAVTDYSSADPRGGLTFAYTYPIPDSDLDEEGNTPYRDKFYICPEIDFSTVQFYVEVLDSQYMTRGEYWGDFSSVVFERDPGTDYDNPTDPDNPENNVDDSTVLHAGEVMYFDLIVRQSGGGGYRIYVQPWSTGTESKTKHYPHPGIYTDAQGNELAGASGSAAWQEKFELYGDGYTDDEENPRGIFRMYGDLSRNAMTFPVGEGYVLDGMGYTLELNRTSETYNITIGNMVDIYIKVGEYMIYIDPDGYIFQFDASTNTYMPTDSRIDITDSKYSYSIDIRTGTIN